MGQGIIRLNWIAAIIATVLPGSFNTSRSQTYIVNDSPFIKGTTVVIPGKEYKRSGYTRLIELSQKKEKIFHHSQIKNPIILMSNSGNRLIKLDHGK